MKKETVRVLPVLTTHVSLLYVMRMDFGLLKIPITVGGGVMGPGIVVVHRVMRIVGGGARRVVARGRRQTGVEIPGVVIMGPVVRRAAGRRFAGREMAVAGLVQVLIITGRLGGRARAELFRERAPMPAPGLKQRPARAILTARSLTPPTTRFVREAWLV